MIDKAILLAIAGMLLWVTWSDRAAFIRILEVQERALIAAQEQAEQRSCQALYFERELAGFYKSKTGKKN